MEASQEATIRTVSSTQQLFLPKETLDHPFDVTLAIQDGKEFKAYRRVLSEASPFFERLLKSDMKESIEGVIHLEMTNEQCLGDILEFIYTGHVQISAAEENGAQDLIIMSDYLVLPRLKTVAGKRLVKDLKISNSVSFYQFGLKYQCDELIFETRNFIHANFMHVAQTEEFLSLSCEEIKMWISNDNISVTAEEDVFKVILRWVSRNKLVRKKYFPELFSEVRLVYVSREFLYSDVMTSEFVISDEHSVGLVKDALKVIESKDFQQRSIRPRKSLEMPVMVICVQGFSKQEDNMLCCYYPLEDKWSKFNGTVPPNIGEIVPCHGKRYFHLFPHEDVGVRERRLLCYDPLSNCWSPFPYEDHRTVKKIFAMNDEAIYALVAEDILCCPDCTSLYLRKIPGPCSKTPHLSFLRKYKPETNSWEDITSFDLDYRHEILGSADRYDLINDTWENLANLQLPRWYARATATHHKIFVVGGVKGDLLAESCEMYDEDTKEWHFVARLRKTPFDHYNPTLLGVDNKLYCLIRLICAWNRKDKIDCYDFEKNEWKEKTQIPFEELSPRGLKNESYLQITSCCSMGIFKRHNFLQHASFKDIKTGKDKCAIM
ncbi:unnamed protein product [Porites lobata]|uniref:BTB domain-containing protein n=1 Tax=Porites lobata TaxID=104759 RepID=A0ABN8PP45_9CNID|nr:unnamed protein product [Porites lobata]